MSANSSRSRNRIATKPSQRFVTPTVECPRRGDVRKTPQPRSARQKNRKRPSAILVLRRKYTDFRAQFAHSYCGSAVIEMPSWECRFLRCAIAVGARRRRAASVSIYIYIYIYIYISRYHGKRGISLWVIRYIPRV